MKTSCLTLISHFYNNTAVVQRHLDFLAAFRAAAGDIVDFILVDDGSSECLDASAYAAVPGLRVYRIQSDVAWNMPAARNIGVLESHTNKVVLIDIDHVFDPASFGGLIALAKTEPRRSLVQFERHVAKPDGALAQAKPHVNSFLIDRRDYWYVGGYDETLSGFYGREDGYFRWRARRLGIRDRVSELTTLVADRGFTVGLDRDLVRNEAVFHDYVNRQQGHLPLNFVFDYARIH